MYGAQQQNELYRVSQLVNKATAPAPAHFHAGSGEASVGLARRLSLTVPYPNGRMTSSAIPICTFRRKDAERIQRVCHARQRHGPCRRRDHRRRIRQDRLVARVSDIIMPPIGLLLNGVNFSDLFVSLNGQAYATLAEAQAAAHPP